MINWLFLAYGQIESRHSASITRNSSQLSKPPDHIFRMENSVLHVEKGGNVLLSGMHLGVLPLQFQTGE